MTGLIVVDQELAVPDAWVGKSLPEVALPRRYLVAGTDADLQRVQERH